MMFAPNLLLIHGLTDDTHQNKAPEFKFKALKVW